MHSLQKRFHDFIQEQQLLKKEDVILLAVSGGLDSMVLAYLFLRSEWDFCIAHCNFNLRGEESNSDENFVNEWAQKNEVKLHSRKFDLGGRSVQLNARNARYSWFDELCKKNNYSKIAVAHHLNDSLETLLINLTRGTGIKGIAGIYPQSGQIIRPLLCATKKQLEEYAYEHVLEWREDSSNSKTDYGRNLLRLEILPKLEKLNPSLIKTFSNTAERLRMANEVVRDKVEKIRESFLIAREGHFELKLDWLKKESDFLVLAEILSAYGFNYITSKKVYETREHSGKTFYSSSFEILIDRDLLYIRENVDPRLLLFNIEEEDFPFEANDLYFELLEKKGLTIENNQNIAYLDANKINYPIQVRNWKEGDRFKPLGMKGTKKISDYLIDRKIPLVLKRDISVVISGGEIVWLAGYQISEDFKITNQTQKVLRAILD